MNEGIEIFAIMHTLNEEKHLVIKKDHNIIFLSKEDVDKIVKTMEAKNG